MKCILTGLLALPPVRALSRAGSLLCPPVGNVTTVQYAFLRTGKRKRSDLVRAE
jgi:hypothetical protein